MPIWIRTVRRLRWTCTYERTCVFICACECGTHVYSTRTGLDMGYVLPTGRGYERTRVFICACKCGTHVYSTRTGPGHGLRTPYRAGCTARTYTGACALHFRVCTCGTVFGLDSASSVSCMCMCVCTVVGMGSPSVVPLVVSTCMRALYSIQYFSVARTGDVPILLVLVLARMYCACTIAQCALCLYLLYSVLAWPARAMYLSCPCLCLHVRIVLVPLHSVYCACTPCTVLFLYQCTVCNVLVPFV